MFNASKNYSKAIALYNKVTEINATSYPIAYYNLALLEAQLNHFEAAIFNHCCPVKIFDWVRPLKV